MRARRSLGITTVMIIAALLIGSGREASASYLDPGSGSYLFQIAVAAILGGSFTLRQWFQRWRAARTRKDEER
jgi:hypothetical protein